MNYYIQGNEDNADKIKAAFKELGIVSNADRYNYKNDNVLYFTAGGMIHMIDAYGSWANIIKTHPDYKELELPVEPKFKVGDWLVYKYCNCFVGGLREAQIVKVKDNGYFFASGTTGSCKFIDDNCRLWSIADAKDGDVLETDNGWACIFKAFDGCTFSSYCFMDSQKWFCEFGSEVHTPDSRKNGKIHPATKEQRDLLFVKMKEAGYQWDAEKKELKKFKPHYDIANFQPFDKVLVRDGCEKWGCELFSIYEKAERHPFITCASAYKQCIPFEGNEHLLGTSDPCDEQYINW